jgi:AraC family transcriptional regulator
MPISSFWDHISKFMTTRIYGGEWLAPATIFHAHDGFDESIWIDQVQETVLAIRLGGSEVRACFGSELTSRADRQFALHPKGGPNHYLACGSITFGQIMLPDELLDRASETYGAPSISGKLRDDLVFVSQPKLQACLFRYLSRAADTADVASRLEMEALALLLVDNLIQVHNTNWRAPYSRGGLAPWQERRVNEFMSLNLADDVALSELAALVGLSTFHFARMFKKTTGLPPHGYLRQLRCEKAKELLNTTNLPITEISAEVGYDTPQAFARMFRAEIGASPSDYRRQLRS